MFPIYYVVDTAYKQLTNFQIGQPRFSDPRYTPYDFNVDHFHELKRVENGALLCFIDGGNSTVISAPNLTIQLTRVYFNLYKGILRVNPKHLNPRIEFFTISFAVSRNGQIFYETELVPVKEEWRPFLPDVDDLRFDSFDPTLRMDTGRAPISKAALTARLFAEWRYGRLVIENELEQGDAIIRDGSLQTATTNERKYANEIYVAALKKNVKLLGLSKTSTLLTSTGYPLIAAIAELSENSPVTDSSWYYHPIVNISNPDHRAEMYAVKLHPRSEYVFRLEFIKQQIEAMGIEEIEQIIATLSLNSEDASFPGYPYGLLDADRFARVGSREMEDCRVQFLTLARSVGLLHPLLKCLRSSNAHDIINQLIVGQ